MNLKKEIWKKEDYEEYITYLKSKKEQEYKKFQERLTPTKYEILGLRVPIQRKIAREILKGNAFSFLKFCQSNYYEEVNIEGFVIAGLSNKEKYLDSFTSKIDNWAICDSFCSSWKIKEEEKDFYYEKIKEFLKSDKTFTIRVGLVLLLTTYVEEKYVSNILLLVNSIKKEEYYVQMAKAWLVAECFIKYPKKTLPYIKEQKLNKFTQNKTISKICDSYRVSKEVKEKLKSYRIVK